MQLVHTVFVQMVIQIHHQPTRHVIPDQLFPFPVLHVTQEEVISWNKYSEANFGVFIQLDKIL